MKSIHTELNKEGFEGWFFPSGDSDRYVITLVDSKGNNIANKGLARWFNQHGCCSLGLGNGRTIRRETGCTNGRSNILEKRWNGLRGVGLKNSAFTASLLAAIWHSLYPDITLTIACEAIDIVMEGFEERKKEGMSEWCCGKSTFTFRGEALPYLPYGLSEHEYYDRIVKSCKEYHELRSRELFQHAEKREIPENAGRIGPFDIAAFVVKLFRSGRRKGNECKDARKQFDSLLADEIRKW